jgi:hypothetical protein
MTLDPITGYEPLVAACSGGSYPVMGSFVCLLLWAALSPPASDMVTAEVCSAV